jgi:membrane-bound serine protease (ClpP class)
MEARRRLRRVSRVLLVLAGLGLAAGVVRSQPAGTTLTRLYEQAAEARAAGDASAYEAAAGRIVARGEAAAEFLTALLETQAELVSSPDDAAADKLGTTINLVGRMNTYPAARRALKRLEDHPVEQVRDWARYAVGMRPRTRPARPEPSGATTGPTTRPGGVVVTEDRIITEDGWFPRPEVDLPDLPDPVTKAFIIPIHGPITPATYDNVSRKVTKVLGSGGELVVFDMNTPGGRIDAMEAIVDLILDDLRSVQTVAYVNSDAYSAGAIISAACTEIVMAPGGVIGDAMPIIAGPGGIQPLPEEERAKIESPLLALARRLAEARGHDVELLESMITLDREVWLVRDRDTGRLRLVRASRHEKKVLGAPGVDPVEIDPTTRWEFIEVVTPLDKLATLNTSEAIRAGFARQVFDGYEQLKRHYDVEGELVKLTDSWSERFVAFLARPAISGLLITIAMICGYVELSSPGFGIPGALALTALALLFGGRYLAGLANWWEIALFFIGIVLIAGEIFITPGFGVLGISGILCCAISLLALLVANPPDELPLPDTQRAWDLFSDGVMWLSLAAIASAVGIGLLMRYVDSIPVANKLFLPEAEHVDTAPVAETSPYARIRPGAVGVVEGPCRPVGKVRFDEDLLDASSEGLTIEAGARVRAVRWEGNRLIVEKVEET